MIHYSRKPLKKDGTYVESSYFWDYDISRDDPVLCKLVKEWGKRANGEHASLRVVKVPDGIDWEIDDYDGMESVSEKHRTWG